MRRRHIALGVGLALIIGIVAGLTFEVAQQRAADHESTTGQGSFGPDARCVELDAEFISFLDTALRRDVDFSFVSGDLIGDLRGPFNGLSLIAAKMTGPGRHGDGDVGIWAVRRGVPPGWTAGPILYALNPTARQTVGLSVFEGKRLQQVTDGRQSVYDPKVIRATAPRVASSCVALDAP